jgi:hypothetical protein
VSMSAPATTPPATTTQAPAAVPRPAIPASDPRCAPATDHWLPWSNPASRRPGCR